MQSRKQQSTEKEKQEHRRSFSFFTPPKKSQETQLGSLNLPIGMLLYITQFLDTKDLFILSITNSFFRTMMQSQQEFTDNVAFLRQILNKSFWLNELTTKDLTTFASITLKCNENEISTSEKFETAILKHILQLNPACSNRLSPDTNVDGKASYYTAKPPACWWMDSKRVEILINYKELTLGQVRDLADGYNSYYPGIGACVYYDTTRLVPNENTTIDATLAMDAKFFCQKVLPVIRGTIDRPFKHEQVAETLTHNLGRLLG